MRQPYDNELAFTIIEVLMVCVISIMFLGVGFAGYRDFSRRQAVLVAKRTVLSDLNLAQKNATTGNKPMGCNGTLLGYSFEVTSTTPTATYEVNAICANPPGPDIEILQFTKSLAQNVTITSPTPNPIIFRPLNKGTNIARNNSVTLSLTSSGQTQSINITWVGEIN